jgi:CRP-like cAMP-binding protein
MAEEASAVDDGLKGKSTLEILAQIDLFSGLPQAHLRRVVDIGVEEQYRTSATIFSENEAGDKFYLIVDGAVRVSRIVPGMGRGARGAASRQLLRRDVADR